MRWNRGHTSFENRPQPPSRQAHQLGAARVVLGAWLLAAAGCGSTGFAPVTGTVTLDDQPLKGGGVTFYSDEHQHLPAGVIADGKYEIFTNGVKGAPPGAYRVVVIADDFSVDQYPEKKSATAALPKSIVALKYSKQDTTPLSVTVTAQPAAGAYDLKVTKQ